MSWFRAASKASAGAADTAEGAEAAARAKIGTLPVRSDQIPRAHGDMQAHIEQEMAMEHAPARKEYIARASGTTVSSVRTVDSF